jgi:hypothetical protein
MKGDGLTLRHRPKMFKDRFRKWGLDKHLNADEVLAIVRAKTAREAIGKATQFLRQGGNQPINYAAVEDYLRRNPAISAQFRSGDPCKPLEALRIISRTPPLPGPERVLAAPERLLAREEMFSAVRDYIDAFASNRKTPVVPASARLQIGHAFGLLQMAARIFPGRIPEAFRLVNEALDTIATHIGHLDLFNISRLMYHIEKLGVAEGASLAIVVYRNFVQLANQLWAPSRPESRLIRAISRSPEQVRFSDLSEVMERSVGIHLRDLITTGRTEPGGQLFLTELLHLVETRESEDNAQLGQAKYLLLEWQPWTNGEARVFWDICYLMCSSYLKLGEYATIIRMLRADMDIMRLLVGQIDEEAELRFSWMFCQAEQGLGNWLEASWWSRKAYRISRSLGWVEWAILCLDGLYHVLRKLGHDEEAECVAIELESMLEGVVARCPPLEPIQGFE